MTGHFTPFALNGAQPIQMACCAARIPPQGMAAPFLFAGECKEKWK
jgi:hypothetical protein